jgi:hypothetical protein
MRRPAERGDLSDDDGSEHDGSESLFPRGEIDSATNSGDPIASGNEYRPDQKKPTL